MRTSVAPRLEEVGNGRYLLKGELSFHTVSGLLDDTRTLVAQSNKVTIDLSGVERTDSAGVALLIEWLREMHRAGTAVTYVNIPPQMLAIARACSIDSILPLARE